MPRGELVEQQLGGLPVFAAQRADVQAEQQAGFS